MISTLGRARIKAIAAYAPGEPVSNEELESRFGKQLNDFLVSQRNIHFRHFAANDICTSDLAFEAARRALDRAGVLPSEIDLVVVATDTPDGFSPSTASRLSFLLNTDRAGTLDVNAACAGWVSALSLAARLVEASTLTKRVLVVGCYLMSRFFDWEDYKTCSVFADGAAAAVVENSSGCGILAEAFLGQSEYYDHMGVYGGGTRFPFTQAAYESPRADSDDLRAPFLVFRKRVPAETNEIYWPALVRKVLDSSGIALGQVDHFFFTQLNVLSIRSVLREMGVPVEKGHLVMQKYGYTGSACIPMALADAYDSGKLKNGDTCVLVASGGGVSMCALALRWNTDIT